MPLFTTGGASGASGKPSPAAAQARAAREKARSEALERRRKRNAAWLEKRIGEIGKGDALKDINQHWQSYTPFEMSLLLNSDEVTQAVEARIMRVAAIFESVRNMLIIVPIMLTWLSLALAGAAYESNLSAVKPNGKPFLQQWQEGFAPLMTIHLLRWNIPLLSHGERWFTFANFALTDAALLCFILLLTIVGQALEIWSYRRSTRVAGALERHMYTLSSQTLLGSLATGPDAKMPPWLRELRTDLGQLRGVIDKMNTALDASMDRYTEAISRQQEAVSALVTDTEKVHDSVVQLNTLYQGGADAAKVYKMYIPDLTQDIAKLAHYQERSMNAMKAQVEMLSKTMLYLGKMTGNVREAQQAIDRYNAAGSKMTGRTPAYQPHPSYSRPEPQEPQEPQEPREPFASPVASELGETQRYYRSTPPAQGSQMREAWPTSEGQPPEVRPGWSLLDGYEPDGGYADGLDTWDYTSDAPLPRRGAWYRLRYRLSSIPVVRVIIRRPR